MGTRATCKVFDHNDNCLLNLYVQSDGYLEGFGLDLKEFLHNRKMVNGIGRNDNLIYKTTGKISNTVYEFAAQLVTYFKTKYPIGQVYLHTLEDTEGWNYSIYVSMNDKIRLKVEEYGNVIFDGNPSEFLPEHEEQSVDPQEKELRLKKV